MRHNLTPDARCAITGAPLTDENVHVDHDPPFIEIARAFLKKIGGVEAINLRSASAGAFVQRFVNTDFEIRWKDFHREHATLFLTTAKANNAQGRPKFIFLRRTARGGGKQPHAQDRATENECTAT